VKPKKTAVMALITAVCWWLRLSWGEIRLGGDGWFDGLLDLALAGETGRPIIDGHIAHGAVEVAVFAVGGVAFHRVHNEFDLLVGSGVGHGAAGDVGAQFSLQLRSAATGGEGVAHSSFEVGKSHAAKFSFGGDALPCRGNLFDLADDTGRILVSGYHSFIFLSNGSCAQAADLQTDRSGGNRMRLGVPYCHTITHCNAVN